MEPNGFSPHPLATLSVQRRLTDLRLLLDWAQDVLKEECSRDNDFGLLALRLMESAVGKDEEDSKGLAGILHLIRPLQQEMRGGVEEQTARELDRPQLSRLATSELELDHRGPPHRTSPGEFRVEPSPPHQQRSAGSQHHSPPDPRFSSIHPNGSRTPAVYHASPTPTIPSRQPLSPLMPPPPPASVQTLYDIPPAHPPSAPLHVAITRRLDAPLIDFEIGSNAAAAGTRRGSFVGIQSRNEASSRAEPPKPNYSLSPSFERGIADASRRECEMREAVDPAIPTRNHTAVGGGAPRRRQAAAALSTYSTASESDSSPAILPDPRQRRGRGSERGRGDRDVRAATEHVEDAVAQASAPPPDAKKREAISLGDKDILERIAAALASNKSQATLVALCGVSRLALAAALPLLYQSIELNSKEMAQKVVDSLANTHGNLVRNLVITPFDASSTETVPDFLPPLQQFLQLATNLRSLDEDMSNTEWDVVKFGKDYPLTKRSAQLSHFASRRCWWEIGAVFALLQNQPELVKVVFGGAVMDRDWEGQKIIAQSRFTLCPRLKSLEVAQVMHEDTLMVLLNSCGPVLESLRIGFQQIGSTDDDTPRASIPLALAQVGSHLRHLAIKAPSKESEDAAGLLEECLAVLPNLEILEFSEAVDSLPASVPIASSKLLAVLPATLRILRGRGIVSFSTSKVLAMLENPNAIPVLECLDLMWAKEERETLWKERHRERIESACGDFGIRCSIGKGDDQLQLQEQL